MASNAVRAGGAFIEIFIKDQVKEGLSKINVELKSFASLSTKAGLALGAIGSLSAFGFGRAIQVAGDFDRKLREIQAATDFTPKGIQQIAAGLKQIASETGQDLIKTAGIAASLSRAFGSQIDVSGISKLTATISKLSKASDEDVGIVGDVLRDTLNQFKLSANDATQVADLLVTAANNSSGSLSDFALSLKFVGPVAAQFNTSLKSVLAYTAALSQIGITGTSAGESLRRLIAITKGQSDDLSSIFGVKIDPNDSLEGTLARISKATQNLDVGSRVAKFRDAFELLGITSATGLAASQTEIQNFIKAFDASSGALDKQFGVIAGGIKSAGEQFRSAFQVFQVGVGDAAAETLAPLVAGLTELLKLASDFTVSNKEIVQILLVSTATAIVAGASLVGVGLAISGVTAAIGGYIKIASLFNKLLAFNPPDKSTQSELNAKALTSEASAMRLVSTASTELNLRCAALLKCSADLALATANLIREYSILGPAIKQYSLAASAGNKETKLLKSESKGLAKGLPSLTNAFLGLNKGLLPIEASVFAASGALGSMNLPVSGLVTEVGLLNGVVGPLAGLIYAFANSVATLLGPLGKAVIAVNALATAAGAIAAAITPLEAVIAVFIRAVSALLIPMAGLVKAFNQVKLSCAGLARAFAAKAKALASLATSALAAAIALERLNKAQQSAGSGSQSKRKSTKKGNSRREQILGLGFDQLKIGSDGVVDVEYRVISGRLGSNVGQPRIPVNPSTVRAGTKVTPKRIGSDGVVDVFDFKTTPLDPQKRLAFIPRLGIPVNPSVVRGKDGRATEAEDAAERASLNRRIQLNRQRRIVRAQDFVSTRDLEFSNVRNRRSVSTRGFRPSDLAAATASVTSLGSLFSILEFAVQGSLVVIGTFAGGFGAAFTAAPIAAVAAIVTAFFALTKQGNELGLFLVGVFGDIGKAAFQSFKDISKIAGPAFDAIRNEIKAGDLEGAWEIASRALYSAFLITFKNLQQVAQKAFIAIGEEFGLTKDEMIFILDSITTAFAIFALSVKNQITFAVGAIRILVNALEPIIRILAFTNSLVIKTLSYFNLIPKLDVGTQISSELAKSNLELDKLIKKASLPNQLVEKRQKELVDAQKTEDPKKVNVAEKSLELAKKAADLEKQRSSKADEILGLEKQISDVNKAIEKDGPSRGLSSQKKDLEKKLAEKNNEFRLLTAEKNSTKNEISVADATLLQQKQIPEAQRPIADEIITNIENSLKEANRDAAQFAVTARPDQKDAVDKVASNAILIAELAKQAKAADNIDLLVATGRKVAELDAQNKAIVEPPKKTEQLPSGFTGFQRTIAEEFLQDALKGAEDAAEKAAEVQATAALTGNTVSATEALANAKAAQEQAALAQQLFFRGLQGDFDALAKAAGTIEEINKNLAANANLAENTKQQVDQAQRDAAEVRKLFPATDDLVKELEEALKKGDLKKVRDIRERAVKAAAANAKNLQDVVEKRAALRDSITDKLTNTIRPFGGFGLDAAFGAFNSGGTIDQKLLRDILKELSELKKLGGIGQTLEKLLAAANLGGFI